MSRSFCKWQAPEEPELSVTSQLGSYATLYIPLLSPSCGVHRRAEALVFRSLHLDSLHLRLQSYFSEVRLSLWEWLPPPRPSYPSTHSELRVFSYLSFLGSDLDFKCFKCLVMFPSSTFFFPCSLMDGKDIDREFHAHVNYSGRKLLCLLGCIGIGLAVHLASEVASVLKSGGCRWCAKGLIRRCQIQKVEIEMYSILS